MADVVDEQFLTIDDVAEKLQVNQQTVRNWIDAGKMPAVRIGRRVRVRRSDFEMVVENGVTDARRRVPPDKPTAAARFWAGELIAEAVLPEAK